MINKRPWQQLEWWLLLAVLLLALGVRIFRIDQMMVFTYDQGRDMYALQKIVRGDITLIGPTTGLPGVFLGPYMYYLLVPGYILSNGNPFGVAIWQTFLIVASFPFLYLLLRPFVGRWWSLLAVFWLALTPGAIDQARTIWNPSLVVMTLLPSLYFLVASQTNKKLLAASFFLFGLSLQTELAYTFFLAPLYAGWLVIHLDLPKALLTRLPSWCRPLKALYDWRWLAVAVIAFGLTLVPQGLFELKNRFLITRSILTEMGDKTKQVSYQQVWEQRPGEIWTEMVDTLSGSAPGGAVIVGLCFLAGIYVLYSYRRKPAALLFSGYLFLPLIGFMFHRGNYGYFFDYYMTAHYLPAIGVVILALAHLTRNKLKLAVASGISLLLVICLVFYHYATIMYNVSLFQYTAAREIQALQHARAIAKTDKPALEVFVPNLVPVSYQYLSEWLSRTGRATPIDFGGDGHQEYILIYEPPIGDGSRVAYQQWYAGWKKDATCDAPTSFGITTVERCERQVTQID